MFRIISMEGRSPVRGAGRQLRRPLNRKILNVAKASVQCLIPPFGTHGHSMENPTITSYVRHPKPPLSKVEFTARPITTAATAIMGSRDCYDTIHATPSPPRSPRTSPMKRIRNNVMAWRGSFRLESGPKAHPMVSLAKPSWGEKVWAARAEAETRLPAPRSPNALTQARRPALFAPGSPYRVRQLGSSSPCGHHRAAAKGIR